MLTEERIYDWKISVIAQYNKLWAPEFNEFIDAIKKQTISAGLRFIVLTYNSPDDPRATGTASVKHYYRGMPNAKDPEPQPYKLYEQETLNNFFYKEVLPVKATRHMFIIWGHGAGLGYFPTLEPSSFTTQDWFPQVFDPVPVVDHDKKQRSLDSMKLANAINFLQANYSIQPDFASALGSFVSFGDNVYEVKKTDQIKDLFKVVTAEQLTNALAVLDQRTDIFIASNCYSQLFDAGFTFKDQVDIMIAAETSIPISGFSYLPFFRMLRTTKTVPKDGSLADQTYLNRLTTNLVNNFNEKYTTSYVNRMTKLDTKLEYHKDAISLSGNKLSFYSDLQKVVEDLGTMLSTDLPVIKPADLGSAIRIARSACRDLASPSDKIGTIDLTFFARQLQQSFTTLNHPELASILERLENIRKECCIALLSPAALSNPTVDVFSPTKPRNCQSPLFVSIYCPLPSGTGKPSLQDALFKLFKEQTKNPAHLPVAKPWDNFVLQIHG